MMQPTEIKPGFQTSEFWISIAVGILGAYISQHALAAHILTIANAVVASVGMIIALIAGLGYGTNRRLLKAKAIETFVQQFLAMLSAKTTPPAVTPAPDSPPPAS